MFRYPGRGTANEFLHDAEQPSRPRFPSAGNDGLGRLRSLRSPFALRNSDSLFRNTFWLFEPFNVKLRGF